MADRPDLPRVFPKESPSFFNREAAGWGLFLNYAFAFVGGFGAAVLFPGVISVGFGVLAGSLLGLATGVMYGGAKGQARQEREQHEGRVVCDPTYLNVGFWIGLMFAGPIGAMVGAVIRKDSMQRDFDEALRIQQDQQQGRGASSTRERGQARAVYMDSVSPQEAALLEQRQKSSAASSHAEVALTSKAQAQDASRA